MRFIANLRKLPLTLLLLLAGVSFASDTIVLSSLKAVSGSEPEEPGTKLEFFGEVNVSACYVSEITQGHFVQKIPVFVGSGAGIQRIDNYVINFTQCELDEFGAPYADVKLTQILNDETLSILSTPQFKLISNEYNGVDSISVPLAPDTDTIINIGLPNGGPVSGLLYLRAYYPVGIEPLAAPYDNVSLEINYN